MGELGSVSMCKRIFKEQTTEQGDVPFFKIGTFGGKADAFISQELFEEYKAKYPYPAKGTILISASGSIGRTVEFTGENEYFQDSNIVWLIHDERLQDTFLKYLYETVKWAGIEGSTIKRLYNDNILKTEIKLPTIAEQKQIGSFFCSLDNLITLHQREYYQVLYSSRDTMSICISNDWEQRKFGDVFDEYSEKNRADLPPLTIIQGGGTIRRDESERALQYDKASLSNYKVVNEGDFIVHLRSFEGGLEKANSQGIISPAYHTFHGEGIDSRFFYAYFRSKKFIGTDLKPHVYGIRDGRSIDIEGMKTIEIPFTSYPEQKLIGDAIDTLNNLITLHQRKYFRHHQASSDSFTD